MTFAQKIKEKRTELKLSQQAVADKLGISRRTYAGWETDERHPGNRETYRKLAAILDCDVNYLLTEDEDFLIEAQRKYGTRGKHQAKALVDELTGLFAGGDLNEDDMDKIMLAIQNAYWRVKENKG